MVTFQLIMTGLLLAKLVIPLPAARNLGKESFVMGKDLAIKKLSKSQY